MRPSREIRLLFAFLSGNFRYKAAQVRLPCAARLTSGTVAAHRLRMVCAEDYRPTLTDLATEPRQEATLKRTRRIEVISYSRRLTLVEYDDALTDSAASGALPVINIPHEQQRGGGSEVDEVTAQSSDLECVYESSSVPASFKLRNLLRLRGRRSNLPTDTKKKGR